MLSLGVGIATGTAVGLVAGFGALVFALGLCRRHRGTLTRYHLPAILLLALAVTGAFGNALWYEQQDRQHDSIRYTVEPCEEHRFGTPETPTVTGEDPSSTVGADSAVRAFGDLPPRAQDVFLATLESNGTYSTRSRPSGIGYQTDNPEVNYVRYDSACYAFVANDPMVLGIWILPHFFVGAGVVLALAVGWRSLRKPRFGLPSAFLGGIASGVGTMWLVSLPSLLVFHHALLFLAAALAGGVPTLGGLRAIEAHRGERFRDRMER